MLGPVAETWSPAWPTICLSEHVLMAGRSLKRSQQVASFPGIVVQLN